MPNNQYSHCCGRSKTGFKSQSPSGWSYMNRVLQSEAIVSKIPHTCYILMWVSVAVSFLSSCSISLSRPSLKEFRDNAEQQHITAQQKAALQVRHTKTRVQLRLHISCLAGVLSSIPVTNMTRELDKWNVFTSELLRREGILLNKAH